MTGTTSPWRLPKSVLLPAEPDDDRCPECESEPGEGHRPGCAYGADYEEENR